MAGVGWQQRRSSTSRSSAWCVNATPCSPPSVLPGTSSTCSSIRAKALSRQAARSLSRARHRQAALPSRGSAELDLQPFVPSDGHHPASRERRRHRGRGSSGRARRHAHDAALQPEPVSPRRLRRRAGSPVSGSQPRTTPRLRRSLDLESLSSATARSRARPAGHHPSALPSDVRRQSQRRPSPGARGYWQHSQERSGRGARAPRHQRSPECMGGGRTGVEGALRAR